MRIWGKLLVSVMVAALACSGAIWAAQAEQTSADQSKAKKAPAKEATAKPKSHMASGEIVSISDTELVLTKVRGKKENVTIELTADTKKTGEMAPGTKVIVGYHNEGGKMIAHSVKVKPMKAAKAKEAKKPAKKST